MWGIKTMKYTLKALGLAIVASASSFTFAEAPASEHTISGNIGVISSYNLRGNTTGPENRDATIQGGLDYSHSSGLYAGYWASTLGYGRTVIVNGEPDVDKGIESDFYAGYKGSINEDLGYTVGFTYYYYYNLGNSDANGFETMLGLNYKDFSVTAQTLLEDVTWGNTGDTYILGSYSHALPRDFTLNTKLGLYYYNDKDGEFIKKADTTETFGFRHFTVGLSHPLADTGVNMNLDYIIGGYDRLDNKHKNKVVLGLSYSF